MQTETDLGADLLGKGGAGKGNADSASVTTVTAIITVTMTKAALAECGDKRLAIDIVTTTLSTGCCKPIRGRGTAFVAWGRCRARRRLSTAVAMQATCKDSVGYFGTAFWIHTGFLAARQDGL